MATHRWQRSMRVAARAGSWRLLLLLRAPSAGFWIAGEGVCILHQLQIVSGAEALNGVPPSSLCLLQSGEIGFIFARGRHC